MMELINRCHERSAAVRAISAFQRSPLYPICLALLCIISGMSKKDIYLPILSLICLSVLFSVLFVKDSKVLIPPMFMLYYALGNEDSTHADHRGDTVLLEDVDTHIFWGVAILIAVLLLLRFCTDGTFARLRERRGAFLGGILAMDVAFLLNGLLSPEWQARNLAYGIVMIFGFTAFYLIFFSITDRALEESPSALSRLTEYSCICVICMAAVVLVQLLLTVHDLHAAGKLLAYTKDDPVPKIIRDHIRLAWGGYATNIALVIILGIPACMYLAKSRRFAAPYFALALVFYVGAALTGTRSTLVIGGSVLLCCILMNCFSGPNRRQFRLLSLLSFAVAVTVFLLINRHAHSLSQLWDAFLELMRLDFLQDLDLHEWVTDGDYKVRPRVELVRKAWNDFLSAPFFGVGFRDGSSNPSTVNGYPVVGIMNYMYHNLPFQFLGSMGVVGIAAFVWHVADVLRVLVRRASLSKTLLLVLPLLISLTSLVDNFFFFLNFQIVYCAYLALAEHSTPTCSAPDAPKSLKNI